MTFVLFFHDRPSQGIFISGSMTAHPFRMTDFAPPRLGTAAAQKGESGIIRLILSGVKKDE